MSIYIYFSYKYFGTEGVYSSKVYLEVSKTFSLTFLRENVFDTSTCTTFKII